MILTPGEIIAGALIGLALLVAAFTRGEYRRAALVMAGAVVMMRLVVMHTPADWRYLASAAIWVSVGADTIRRGLVASGAILILSGLCYAAQQQYGAAPAIGNPALVAADLLWLAALGVVCRAGLDHGKPLGSASRGRGFLAGSRRDTMATEAGGE